MRRLASRSRRSSRLLFLLGACALVQSTGCAKSRDDEKPALDRNVALGDLESLERQLASGLLDLDARDSNFGQSPLHWAARWGRTDLVESLLQAGADVEVRDPAGRTPLHLAGQYGHWPVARQLVHAGADMESRSRQGMTPLHYAAWWTRAEWMDSLLVLGAAVGASDADGQTALHWALTHPPNPNHARPVEAARVLLAHGADPKAITRNEETPLHYAVLEGEPEAVRLLLDRGADVNARSIYNTPATIAVEHHRWEVLDLLLERGADVSGLDHRGLSVLLQLIQDPDPENLPVFDHLIRAGAPIALKDGKGLLPLHHAIVHRHLGYAGVLIDRGADVNAGDLDQRTALHWAAARGDSDAVRFLLGRGANPALADRWGATPAQGASPGIRRILGS